MLSDVERLRDRFRASFLAHASGDAIGKRVETMTPEAIKKATGGRGVTGFGPVLHASVPTIARLRPDQWSDDTQIPIATARALIRGQGFDLRRIAAELVAEYMRERRGWGGSVERGIGELAAQERQPGEPVRDSEAHGLGNGVANRVLPIALMTALPPGERDMAMFHEVARRMAPIPQMLKAYAELTHRDPCARIGAHIMLLCLHRVLSVSAQEWQPPQRKDWSIFSGMELTADEATCPVHRDVLARTFNALATRNSAATSSALQRTSSSVLESVPFVIATALKHLDDPPAVGILAAVNAGGDTDSNAAMVGSLLGARHGTRALPPEWVERIEARETIITLADALFDLMRKPT